MTGRQRSYAILLASLAVAADQISKRWASTGLRQAGGHMALPGPVDLTLSLNQSNAFGLTPVIGHSTRWFLMGVNLLVAAIILYVLLFRRVRPLTGYGLAFVMAGAVGNALDRPFFGAVVDFLDASKLGFIWIFNLADTAINLGIGLMILSALTERRSTAPNLEAEGP
jgi:signal peptidase II